MCVVLAPKLIVTVGCGGIGKPFSQIACTVSDKQFERSLPISHLSSLPTHFSPSLSLVRVLQLPMPSPAERSPNMTPPRSAREPRPLAALAKPPPPPPLPDLALSVTTNSCRPAARGQRSKAPTKMRVREVCESGRVCVCLGMS